MSSKLFLCYKHKFQYCFFLFFFQRKKKAGSSDEEDAMLSGSDVDIAVSVAPRADRPGRRQATKKINYSGLLESEEEETSDDELVFKDNEAVKAPTNKATIISDDESDECVVQSEEINLPAPKKKTVVKRPRKNKSSTDSEDEKKVCI